MPRFPNWKLPVSLLLLVAVTAVTIGWLVHTAKTVRQEARSRFFEQYNRQQLLMAEQAGRAIEDLFATFRKDLSLIVSLFEGGEVTAARAEEVKSILLKARRSLEDLPVTDLALFDREGTVVMALPPSPGTVGTNLGWRDYFIWARDQGEPGEIYVPPFRRLVAGTTRGQKALLVVEGVYGPERTFNGLVLFAVDFDELARRYVLPVRIGEGGYAWLADINNRTILVNPNGRLVGQSFEDVILPRWPKLYSLLLSTEDGKPGTGWYDFEDPADPSRTVRKLVAFHPVRIEGHLWTLGVATPQREAEELLSSFLRRQEIFFVTQVVIWLLGTLTVGSLLVFWNRVLAQRVSARTLDLEQAQTELQQTFDELLAARNLAAVGELATGLAHEIRNPLSSIRINVQMIREETQPDGVLDESFDIVEGEVRRLNRLLGDVLGFARPSAPRPSRVDIGVEIQEVLQFTRGMLTENGVEIRTEVDGNLVLDCDPEQIRQVLLNLILNAADAMRDVTGPKVLSISAGRDGEMVRLEVNDTGVGVDPDQQSRIFDPFFTTKAQGGGLGLATVKRIVLNHQGSVEVTSGGERGATFTVQLPVAGPRVRGEVTHA